MNFFVVVKSNRENYNPNLLVLVGNSTSNHIVKYCANTNTCLENQKYYIILLLLMLTCILFIFIFSILHNQKCSFFFLLSRQPAKFILHDSKILNENEKWNFIFTLTEQIKFFLYMVIYIINMYVWF